MNTEHPTKLSEIPGTWFATRHQFPLGWVTIVAVHRVVRTRFSHKAKRAASLINYVDDKGRCGWLPARDLWRTEAAAQAECIRRTLVAPFDTNYVREVPDDDR